MRLRYTFLLEVWVSNGWSPYGTMASDFIRSTRSASSDYSSDCTKKNIPGQAWGSQSADGSSSATAGESGPKAHREAARPSTSRCPVMTMHGAFLNPAMSRLQWHNWDQRFCASTSRSLL